MLRRHDVENRIMTVKRFPNCNCILKTVYTIKALIKIIKLLWLMHRKKYLSVAVAMGGRARGSVSAVLDFFVIFCVEDKK